MGTPHTYAPNVEVFFDIGVCGCPRNMALVSRGCAVLLGMMCVVLAHVEGMGWVFVTPVFLVFIK